MDDFSEFCTLVGTGKTCYGVCQSCDDIFIRDPDTYTKPKMECDPEGIDGCKFFLPVCDCLDGRVLFDQAALDECTYPDCECGYDCG